MNKRYSVLIVLGVLALTASVAAAAKPVYPSWSRQINTPTRFTVLTAFGGAAVLDNETGLVWERTPSTGVGSWFDRLERCYDLEVGGRMGWRVPTIEELASLVDRSQPAPMLPAGNPFSIQPGYYWSATTDPAVPSSARVLIFDNGTLGSFGKTVGVRVWCVRGGQGIDGVQ